jgi:hypothetical protein
MNRSAGTKTSVNIRATQELPLWGSDAADRRVFSKKAIFEKQASICLIA